MTYLCFFRLLRSKNARIIRKESNISIPTPTKNKITNLFIGVSQEFNSASENFVGYKIKISVLLLTAN